MTPDELRENVEDAIAMGISADVIPAGIAAEVVRLTASAVLEEALRECKEAHHRCVAIGDVLGADTASFLMGRIRALAATWAKAEGKKS